MTVLKLIGLILIVVGYLVALELVVWIAFELAVHQ